MSNEHDDRMRAGVSVGVTTTTSRKEGKRPPRNS